MVVKYKEKETFEIGDIIICIFNTLYKRKMELVVSDFLIYDVIDELEKIVKPFVGEVTINSSSKQREHFIAKCIYLRREKGKFTLNKGVSPYFITGLLSNIEENKITLINSATETVLLRKSRGIITYREQILLSLYALLKNYNLREVNSFELYNYREELLKFFRSIKKKIFLEEYMKDTYKFNEMYRKFIETETNKEIIYTLKSNLELKDLYNLLINTIPLLYIEALTTDDITYSAFNRTKILTKD